MTRDQPDLYSAWYVRGKCHEQLNQFPQAIGCYNACIALRPKFPWGWHDRGVMYLKSRYFEDALADCSKAIELPA